MNELRTGQSPPGRSSQPSRDHELISYADEIHAEQGTRNGPESIGAADNSISFDDSQIKIKHPSELVRSSVNEAPASQAGNKAVSDSLGITPQHVFHPVMLDPLKNDRHYCKSWLP